MLFYLCVAAVFTLAVLPSTAPPSNLWQDKLNHLVAFFVLALLLDRAYGRLPLWRVQFLLLAAYGLLIEVVQHFLSWRTGTPWDVLANLSGLIAYAGFRPLASRMGWLPPDYSAAKSPYK